MPASGPAKSGTSSGITGSPVSAKRAGSPLALSTTRVHCGLRRSSTRDRIVAPPIRVSGLSPPPIRRAKPPASTRPSVGVADIATNALHPLPEGEGRTPERSEGGRGGVKSAATKLTPPRLASLADPPPPGEGEAECTALLRSIIVRRGLAPVL